MKKTIFLWFVPALFFLACGNGNEAHYTEVLYPSSRSKVIMADQTKDSLVIASTDSWKLMTTAPEWCTFPSEAGSFTNKYPNTWFQVSLPINFKVNDTGKLRTGIIHIDGGESTNAAYYMQVPFLGIARPQRIVSSDLTENKMSELQLLSTSTRDSIAFTVFSDWTLVPLTGTWLSLETAQGPAGEHTVYLTLHPNTTTAERRDTILLTSNGITDSIPVLQNTQIKIDN